MLPQTHSVQNEILTSPTWFPPRRHREQHQLPWDRVLMFFITHALFWVDLHIDSQCSRFVLLVQTLSLANSPFLLQVASVSINFSTEGCSAKRNQSTEIRLFLDAPVASLIGFVQTRLRLIGVLLSDLPFFVALHRHSVPEGGAEYPVAAVSEWSASCSDFRSFRVRLNVSVLCSGFLSREIPTCGSGFAHHKERDGLFALILRISIFPFKHPSFTNNFVLFCWSCKMPFSHSWFVCVVEKPVNVHVGKMLSFLELIKFPRQKNRIVFSTFLCSHCKTF